MQPMQNYPLPLTCHCCQYVELEGLGTGNIKELLEDNLFPFSFFLFLSYLTIIYLVLKLVDPSGTPISGEKCYPQHY